MNQFLRYISEVNKNDIKKIGSRINSFIRKDTSEPFNDIFHGNARIVIPINAEEHSDFEKYLYQLGLRNIDLVKGVAERTISTQKGEKQQEVRIGKFIKSIEEKSNKEGKSEESNVAANFLSWWEKNKDKIANSPKKQGVSIIISRHPLDLLRMSDHSEFSSCHSPGGVWYKCAIQEAKSGGAIAYVVRNLDLDKIKNLQTKEIFKDEDRNIDGIEPLERVRLRRFTDDKSEYLVPEIRTYGTKHVGLYRAVKDWALRVQSARLKDPDFKKMKLEGGTYSDNSATKIWSDFLDKEVDVREKKVGGKAEHRIDEEDVREVVAGHEYKHYYINAEVEEVDGEDYISYSADVGFEFPLEKMKNLPAKNDWQADRDIERAIRDARLDIYSINDISFDRHENKFYIYISLFDEEGGGTLESLERFLDIIDEYDKDYEEIKTMLTAVLWNSDYYSSDYDTMQFNYLSFEEVNTEKSQPEYRFVSPEFEVGELAGLHTHVFPVGKEGREVHNLTNQPYITYISRLSEALNRKVKEILDIEKKEIDVEVIVEASKEIEGIDHNRNLSHDFSQQRAGDTYKSGIINATLHVESYDDKPESVEEVKKVDDNFKLIESNLKKLWQEIVDKYKKEVDVDKNSYIPKEAAHKILNYLEGSLYFIGGGEVYVRDGEYWYKNKSAKVDQLAGPLVNKVKEVYDKYGRDGRDLEWKTQSYHALKEYEGIFKITAENGNIIPIWIFTINKKVSGKVAPFQSVFDQVVKKWKELADKPY